MTSRILLCYHSDEGQTAKVAARIAQTLTERGCDVTSMVAEEDPSPADFDGVVMGDSIHVGKHSREMRRWAADHRAELEPLPVALFQVSLTSAHDDDESVATATQFVLDLTESAGFEPDLVGMFAGAIVYTRYGWLKRRAMQRIAAADFGDTDPSRDYEYTDWEAVEHFALDCAKLFARNHDDAYPMI